MAGRLQCRPKAEIRSCEMDEPPGSRAPIPESTNGWRNGRLAAATLALIAIALVAWLLLRPGPEPAALPAKRAAAPPSTSPPAPAPIPAPDVRHLAKSEQIGRAFRTAFGRPGSASLRISGQQYLEDDVLTYRPAALEWIGDTAALISLGTNRSDCHACTGAISVHYLKPVDGGFAVDRRWLTAMTGSGWGEPTDKMIIRHDLASFPVIASETGFTGQGCTSGQLWLTELRPEGPVRWDPVPIVYDDSGKMGAEESGRFRSVHGKISGVRKDVSFAVAYSGAETFRETYRRQGNSFVRSVKTSRMPSC